MNEHEINYRSEIITKKVNDFKLVVCGAGALGSNLVNILSRQGFKNITVIDLDRVEASNVATQIYSLKDVGQMKVNALKAHIYNTTKNVLEVFGKELNESNVDRLLGGYDLIVDVFDNWKSRSLVKNSSLILNKECIHAGMSDDGFSEIKWNSAYSIPKFEIKQKDICDYPLAANLVHLTVPILAEIIVQFISDGKKVNREITLKDILVHKI